MTFQEEKHYLCRAALFCFVAAAFWTSGTLFAQVKDIAGSQDHPLVSRSKAFDVVVMPVREQWFASGAVWMIGTKAAKPQLQTFTLTLVYSPGVLSEGSPVPPEGAMPAKKARAFTMGVDLIAMGCLEDPTKEWSIAAEMVCVEGRTSDLVHAAATLRIPDKRDEGAGA